MISSEKWRFTLYKLGKFPSGNFSRVSSHKSRLRLGAYSLLPPSGEHYQLQKFLRGQDGGDCLLGLENFSFTAHPHHNPVRLILSVSLFYVWKKKRSFKKSMDLGGEQQLTHSRLAFRPKAVRPTSLGSQPQHQPPVPCSCAWKGVWSCRALSCLILILWKGPCACGEDWVEG